MNLKDTSKFISLILRQKPETIGITLDEYGWADVDELIAGISKTRPIDRAILEQIVAEDEKQRFRLMRIILSSEPIRGIRSLLMWSLKRKNRRSFCITVQGRSMLRLSKHKDLYRSRVFMCTFPRMLILHGVSDSVTGSLLFSS